MAAVSILMTGLAVLGWLMAALAGLLLVLVLAVLFLPADLVARLEGDVTGEALEAAADPADLGRALRYRLDLRWAWGLLAVQSQGDALEQQTVATVAGFRVGRRRRDRRAPVAPKKPESKSKPRRKRRRRTDLVLIRALVAEGIRLVRRMRRSGRLRATGAVTYGFTDPSITGTLLALRSVFWWLRPGVRMTPDWQTAGATGWVKVAIRVYAAELAAAALAAWWKGPVRKRWWPGFKARLTETFPIKRTVTGGSAS